VAKAVGDVASRQTLKVVARARLRFNGYADCLEGAFVAKEHDDRRRLRGVGHQADATIWGIIKTLAKSRLRLFIAFLPTATGS
jgi:hypothetical protein